MPPGLLTETRSTSIRTGLLSLTYSLTAPESSLVPDLESAFSEDSVGTGITGDVTGTTITCNSTTTRTSHTAEQLRIATAAAAKTLSTIAIPRKEMQMAAELRRLTPSPERALERSVVLITVAASVDIRPAGSRALAADGINRS